MSTTRQIIRTAKDGSYALALFCIMSDGTYEFVSYGLYSSNGEFLGFFSTEEALHEHMNGIDTQFERQRSATPKA
jgi:hypothetical protein